jgi:hypothetical protein
MADVNHMEHVEHMDDANRKAHKRNGLPLCPDFALPLMPNVHFMSVEASESAKKQFQDCTITKLSTLHAWTSSCRNWAASELHKNVPAKPESSLLALFCFERYGPRSPLGYQQLLKTGTHEPS